MKKLSALLIDDDREFCQAFLSIAETSFNLKVKHSGREGLNELDRYVPQVVLLDLKLGSGMNGLEVLKRIKAKYPELPVIMITESANIETAVEAMKLGALHYTSKAPNIETLKLLIERQLEQINWKILYQEQAKRKEKQMVADSPAMKTIKKKIEVLSDTDSTVLIEGESGTGKEICAQEIYRHSSRKDKPFVSINCANLSPQLFESEFFGHEKGAFTGAHTQRKGKLELAHTGTIFLDEIGELPLESQAKILRAIEEQKFERLGGSEIQEVDVRIIVATNKDLKQLVEEKKFREDLYYRLNVISIFIPPLRERIEDIPGLAKIFFKSYRAKTSKPIPDLSPDTIKKLQSYNWPGNIRELRNYIERLVVFFNIEHQILADDITVVGDKNKFLLPPEIFDVQYEEAKRKVLENFKKVYIKKALKKNKGKLSTTARELGINRSSLYVMIKQLDIKH